MKALLPLPWQKPTSTLVSQSILLADCEASFVKLAQDPLVACFHLWPCAQTEPEVQVQLDQIRSENFSGQRRDWVCRNETDPGLLGMVTLRDDQGSTKLTMAAAPGTPPTFMIEAISQILDSLPIGLNQRLHASCLESDQVARATFEGLGFVLFESFYRYSPNQRVMARILRYRAEVPLDGLVCLPAA